MQSQEKYMVQKPPVLKILSELIGPAPKLRIDGLNEFEELF